MNAFARARLNRLTQQDSTAQQSTVRGRAADAAWPFDANTSIVCSMWLIAQHRTLYRCRLCYYFCRYIVYDRLLYQVNTICSAVSEQVLLSVYADREGVDYYRLLFFFVRTVTDFS